MMSIGALCATHDTKEDSCESGCVWGLGITFGCFRFTKMEGNPLNRLSLVTHRHTGHQCYSKFSVISPLHHKRTYNGF